MIFITQLIYIKEGQENVFHQFEEIAIPIILKYKGRLLLRIRPTEDTFLEDHIDKPYEIHLVEFNSEQDFQNFSQDEERKKFLHLKNQSIQSSLVIKGVKIKKATRFNFMEKIMLQHAYPPKLISDCLGIVLGIYFLWINHLGYALLSLFGLSIFGNLIAWKQDINKLAETKPGKWMLLQAKPINLIVRSIGAIVLAYGVWLHSLYLVLPGIGIIVLARLISKYELSIP